MTDCIKSLLINSSHLKELFILSNITFNYQSYLKNWKDIFKYDWLWKVMLDNMKSSFKWLQLINKLLMQSVILSPIFQIFTNIYISYI